MREASESCILSENQDLSDCVDSDRANLTSRGKSLFKESSPTNCKTRASKQPAHLNQVELVLKLEEKSPVLNKQIAL